MRLLAAAAVTGALIVAVGCGGDANDSGASDDEQQIQALAERYSQAALDGDAAAACDTFSDEAIERINAVEEFDGCEDFAEYGFGVLSDEQKAELAELSDIEVDGDTATAVGRDGTITFIRQDGEWKAHLDDEG